MSIGQREMRMVAEGLIVMFGPEAEDKALERAEDYKGEAAAEGRQFWTKIAATIRIVQQEKLGE